MLVFLNFWEVPKQKPYTDTNRYKNNFLVYCFGSVSILVGWLWYVLVYWFGWSGILLVLDQVEIFTITITKDLPKITQTLPELCQPDNFTSMLRVSGFTLETQPSTNF